MNRLLLLALLLVVQGEALGQTIPDGRWYTIIDDRILGLELTPDYLISMQFDWDLHPITSQPSDTATVISIVRQHGNMYYLLRKLDDTSGILLSTYRMIVPGQSFITAINVLNGAFMDTGAIMQYIASDSGAKYGCTFYSQTEMERLRKLPLLKTMSVKDLQRLLQRMIALVAEIREQANGSIPPEWLVFGYAPGKFRDYVADLGYSPLAPLSQLDKLIALHKNDTRLKPLIKKMKQ